MSDLLLPVLLAWIPVIYLSSFLHEMGHAILGRLGGYLVTSFGMGLARPIWVSTFRGTRIYFCSSQPFQGLTWVFHPDLSPARWQQALMLSGGVLAHCLLVVVAVALLEALPWGSGVWLTVAVGNGLLALTNLVPFKFPSGKSVFYSDGALLYRTLRGRNLLVSPTDYIRMVRAQDKLREVVGDVTGRYLFLFAEAASWLEVGDVGEAERLGTLAESLPVRHTPFTKSFGALVRGMIHCATDRLGEAIQALAEADAGFQLLGSSGGLFLVACQRAVVLALQGDGMGAMHLLEELTDKSLLDRRPNLRAAWLAARVTVASCSSDAAALAEAVQAYHQLDRGFRSDPTNLQVHQVTARWHTGRSEWTQAAASYREALGCAARIYERLPSQEDQERYRGCQAGLLAEARESLLRVGLASEAEKLDGMFRPPIEKAAPAEGRASRFCRRLSLGLSIFNLLFAVVLVRGAAEVISRDSGQLLGVDGLLLLLALLLALALITPLVFVLGISQRLIPGWRGRGGQWMLALALLPWIIWVIAVWFFLTLIPYPRY